MDVNSHAILYLAEVLRLWLNLWLDFVGLWNVLMDFYSSFGELFRFQDQLNISMENHKQDEA